MHGRTANRGWLFFSKPFSLCFGPFSWFPVSASPHTHTGISHRPPWAQAILSPNPPPCPVLTSWGPSPRPWVPGLHCEEGAAWGRWGAVLHPLAHLSPTSKWCWDGCLPYSVPRNPGPHNVWVLSRQVTETLILASLLFLTPATAKVSAAPFLCPQQMPESGPEEGLPIQPTACWVWELPLAWSDGMEV